MNEAGARQGFQCSDNGLAYIHILIAKICRKTSFLHLQVLQMVLDALLVFPIMRIGRIIGSERVSRLSGMAYAAFLPEIWLAAVPGYDFWASFGLIVSTWIFLESWTGIERGHKSYFLFIVPGSALIGFCGVVRSTVFFYPIFFILLTPLFYKLPKARYALAVVCALVGWSMAAVPKMIQNYRIYGTAKLPGRKSPPKIPGASSTW